MVFMLLADSVSQTPVFFPASHCQPGSFPGGRS